MKKWFRYKIDYEYGNAELWARDRIEEPLDKFYVLADECFGIRKSIGETKLLDEDLLPLPSQVETPTSTGEQIMKSSGGDYNAVMLQSMVNKSRKERLGIDDKAQYILCHSGGDVIIFTKRGRKIKSEWD